MQQVLSAGAFVLCLAASAGAQDVGQLIKTADEHLAAYRYQQAFDQYGAIPDSATAEQLLEKHTGMAMALMGASRFTEETNQHVEQALEVAHKIGTDSALARAENIRGQYLGNTRTGDRGLSSLLYAAQLAERGGEPARKSLAAIYHNLSGSYQDLEDWERTAYYAQRAFELTPNPSPSDEFNYHVARGIAFFELYERDQAEKEYLRALELSTATKRPRDRALALSELAFTYWTFDHDNARAFAYYTESIEYARLAKVPSLEANSFANRGNVYRDSGDYARAEADYREGIRLLDANNLSNNTFFMWKNIGQVMRLRGQTQEAIALLTKLIDEKANTAVPRHLWQAHMELASALATAGNRAAAAPHFEQMVEIIEEQRKSSILDAFRTGTFAHALSAYDPYDRYIKFLIEGEGSSAIETLAIAERARARGFLEEMASVRGVAAKLPAAVFEEESRVTRAISDAQRRLRSTTLDKAQREAALAALAAAEDTREQFILKMRVEYPNLAEARYPSLLKPAEIQASLRPGETAMAFFLSEPNSLRWTVRRDAIRLDKIAGRAAIERDAGRLRELLRGLSPEKDLRDASSRLSSALFSGVDVIGDAPTSAKAAVGKPLTIIPHGVLHYIPFEVLPVGDRLLVERHAVSYAPSLNALVQLRRSPSTAAAFRVLAVGDPALAPRVENATYRAGDIENLALLEPLPYAAQELWGIGRTFPGRTRILSGAGARETDLRSPLTAHFPVIHFATHGLVSDEQPKRSGLLMAPEQGEDGLLQVSEIYGLGLKANLIVLSACQTALGKEITGEGLIGLSRAFFYAGARAVVATLWNLNDRFAAEFVERFYRELNTGVGAEEALRRAKAAYVRDPKYSHPFYWSSLVLLGDGTMPLVPEPVQPPKTLTLTAGLLVLLAAAVTAARSRKSAKI